MMVVERTLLVDSGVVEGMAVVEVDEAVRPNNLNIVVKNFKVYFGSISTNSIASRYSVVNLPSSSHF